MLFLKPFCLNGYPVTSTCLGLFHCPAAGLKQWKPYWKEKPKLHSTKAYADDATLISTSKEVHTNVLNEVDLKASNFKACPCDKNNAN